MNLEDNTNNNRSRVTGNKGEWSEFYAFLKILADKVLHSADENLILIPSSFIKILQVIREEKKSIVYEIDRTNDKIVIQQKDKVLATLPIISISSKLDKILQRIKLGTDAKGAFTLPEAQELMQELHCEQLKSDSSKKADIFLRIDDAITGTKPIKGFSIKSRIGGMSTLLNASKATNFEFKIIQGLSTPKSERRSLLDLKSILSSDETLEFVKISNDNFSKNLTMIDSNMPRIVAELVKAYYLGYGKNIKELTEFVAKRDPLNLSNHRYFYEYKIQELLRAVAFGMQPTKLWTGDYEAHGGYIIVKENGELACYHTYDRDSFGKFLYLNTKLETPSRTRHGFGSMYEVDDSKFVKLNLQIRFNN